MARSSESTRAPRHGRLQSSVDHLLHTVARSGSVLTECPIFTADGVKAADVAWASDDTLRELGERPCFPVAPEVCVEVLSPRNTDAEIREKKALYFDAGAREVWICAESGEISFFTRHHNAPMTASEIFPDFPSRIALR